MTVEYLADDGNKHIDIFTSMLRRMRTTVILPDELYDQVKRAAQEANQTVTSLLEDALRRELSRRLSRRDATPAVTLPRPYTGRGGVRTDVDIVSGATVLDLMDDGLPIDTRR